MLIKIITKLQSIKLWKNERKFKEILIRKHNQVVWWMQNDTAINHRWQSWDFSLPNFWNICRTVFNGKNNYWVQIEELWLFFWMRRVSIILLPAGRLDTRPGLQTRMNSKNWIIRGKKKQIKTNERKQEKQEQVRWKKKMKTSKRKQIFTHWEKYKFLTLSRQWAFRIHVTVLWNWHHICYTLLHFRSMKWGWGLFLNPFLLLLIFSK